MTTDAGKPCHTLILCADQLSPFAPGYAGRGWARTPALDALAARGTVFTDAVCNSPICVPARASMATGRYVHELGTWDNAHAYSGAEAPSWGTLLGGAGKRVATIGKLHYRDDGPQTGFGEQVIPMHAEGGTGDTFSLLRDDLPARPELREMISGAKAGPSSYTAYDHAVTTATVEWLRRHADDHEPWTLFVSHVSPHHPLIAPEAFLEMYSDDDVPMPVQWQRDVRPDHPALERFRRYYGFDGDFSEDEVRQARRVYLALCSYLDHQIKVVMDALDAEGLTEHTRIIFTSDHGDNAGDHGLWWKNCMYAGAVGVPMIMAGPDIAAGAVCRTPVSLVDLAPTIAEFAGLEPFPEMVGTSLCAIAAKEDDLDRLVFAEYHATGSSAGMFLVSDGHYKYVEYIGEACQLFDRQRDPMELVDLGTDPAYAEVRAGYAARLREICDPQEVHDRARRQQRATVERFGGVEAVLAAGYRTHVPTPDESS